MKSFEDIEAPFEVVADTSSLFGAIASSFGVVWTVALFAVMSLAGTAVAATLKEVQSD